MTEYREKIDNMVWSYSRLSAFEHCKYEFYLQYIIGDDDEYLSEGNFYAESGLFVHDILARIMGGEIAKEDAVDYFIDNFDDNVFYRTRQSTMDSTFEKCATYFAEEDFGWLKDYEIVGVEQNVNFTISGYKFTGFIDLLLKDKDGHYIILDHKSSEYPFMKKGGVKKKSEKQFAEYKRQLYLYAYAVHELYGEYPIRLAWNHFKDGGQIATIPFEQEEFENAIDWALGTISDIENEEDWEGKDDFFYCHNLCNFRHSCEYNIS
jgi:hypothetical protein